MSTFFVCPILLVTPSNFCNPHQFAENQAIFRPSDIHFASVAKFESLLQFKLLVGQILWLTDPSSPLRWLIHDLGVEFHDHNTMSSVQPHWSLTWLRLRVDDQGHRINEAHLIKELRAELQAHLEAAQDEQRSAEHFASSVLSGLAHRLGKLLPASTQGEGHFIILIISKQAKLTAWNGLHLRTNAAWEGSPSGCFTSIMPSPTTSSLPTSWLPSL